MTAKRLHPGGKHDRMVSAILTGEITMSEENNRQEEQTLQQRYSKAEIDDILADDPDEAPTEWVPTRFEKRVKAIPEARWTLYQILGGAAIGGITVASLFLGGRDSGMSWGFLVSVVLALLVPNWLEDRGRRKVMKGRYAMIAVIAVGIIALILYTGLTKGWDSFRIKKAADAAWLAGNWLRL